MNQLQQYWNAARIATLVAILAVGSASTASAQTVPDPTNSTCPTAVTVGPTGSCCFDVVVRDNANNPIAGSVVQVTFNSCSVVFCPTQPAGVTIQGNSARVVSDAAGRAHICVCATFSGAGCSGAISADGVVLRAALPVHGCVGTSTICGTQFYDVNCDGTFQIAADVGIPGWPITLTAITGGAAAAVAPDQSPLAAVPDRQHEGGTSPPPPTFRTVTDSLGHYCFTEIPSGTYNVCSANYVGFGTTPTTPVCRQLTVGGGQALTADFGLCHQCVGSLLTNGDFHSGLSPGWSIGYGTPTTSAGTGCDDPGYVSLSGNKTTGSAIVQTLLAPTQVGKIYELRFCARLSSSSALDYGKVRAVALDGSLPAGGTHPGPSASLAIIDISPKINCSDWSTYTLHRWRASKSFTRIALSVDNNQASAAPSLQSALDLDDICFVAVGDTLPCYMAPLDSVGNPIPPFGSVTPDCPPMDDTLDVYTGSITDLYGSLCPTAALGVDTFYDDPGCRDSCASLGGTLPPELKSFVLDDSLSNYLHQVGIDSVGDVVDSLLAIETRLQGMVGNPLDTLLSLGAFPAPCDSVAYKTGPPQPTGPSPFQGRDIIFVHGFRTDALGDRIMGVAGARKRWPFDKTEFTDDNGYWKKGANDYWRDHIETYLKVPPEGATSGSPGGTYNNRFLVVAHPATQTGIIGVHAILWQIAKAMKDGTGVKLCNYYDPRHTTGFGQGGFVIISHSDGALFTNVSLSIADLIGKTPILNALLGDVGYIADRCDLHISLQGATAGSGLAPALLLAATVPGLQQFAKQAMGVPDNVSVTWVDVLPWLYTSQTLDMTIPHFIYGGELFQKLCGPIYSPLNPACYLANHNFIEDVPMKVITLAGGHPSSYGVAADTPATHSVLLQILSKVLLYHGFDDGVVSLDGAAGNSDSRWFFPNRYLPQPGLLTLTAFVGGGPLGDYDPRLLLNERLYDMGIALRRDGDHARAIDYYLDQKLDVLIAKLKNDLACGLQLSDLCISPHPPFELLYASAGAVPWLSPTGMVQPVFVARPGGPGYDALKRWNNHYSMIQSASDHYTGANYLHDANYVEYPSYQPTRQIHDHSVFIPNAEEVRVVTDPGIYDVVNAGFKNLQGETIRGFRIGGWCILRFGGKCRLRFPTLWIWKRKYHQLIGYDTMHQLDYVYQYVLKP